MAKGITDLGIGLGYIYKTDVDGSTIVSSYFNSPENARDIKVEGVKATSTALGRSPVGTINVDAITNSDTISKIKIGGINKIINISFLSTDSPESLASAIALSFNESSKGSDYTATANGSLIVVTGEVAIGDTQNGQSIIITTGSAGATFTTTDIEGGSGATEVYDTGIGWRFFIDADYGATDCSGGGTATPNDLTNAVEITDFIVPRSLNSSLPVEIVEIVSDSITITRKSAISFKVVNTEASAATDDLSTISTEGFADFDIIYLLGKKEARVLTVKSGIGNIELTNSIDFISGDKTFLLYLFLKNGIWYEFGRSTSTIGSTADFRNSGFGFFGNDAFNTQATADGLVTFDGNVDAKYQKLTGATTLISNSLYVLGSAVEGDEFWLEYDSSVVVGAFSLSIFGIILTSEQALNGGLMFYGKYMSGSWRTTVSPNLNPTLVYPYKSPASSFSSNSIVVDKVEPTLKTELITFPISWDANRLGDHKIVMPYPCSIVEINTYNDDLIDAADDCDVDFKNNAAASMGISSFVGGTTIGTGKTLSPTINNVFAKGDVLTATTTKTTPGGNAKVSVEVIKI